MNTLCCIGHITRDKIVTPERAVYMSGGVAYYFSYALSRLPRTINYTLVTKLAPPDRRAAEDIRATGIDVRCLDAPATVCFENIYSPTLDERRQRVPQKSEPFTINDVRDIHADIIHLGTLLSDDFPIEAGALLHRRGRLSIDVQGFLRKVRGGEVEACDWERKEEWLRLTDIIKMNEAEMETLTGSSDSRKAARMIAAAGPQEVIITLGALGSLILCNGEFISAPAYPPAALIDTTGCGDTFMAGYLYRRVQGASPLLAARFAAAMCALKIAHNGPFAGTEDDIRRVINDASGANVPAG
ncbi:MAG: PfkB family carbohydrate kinase [Prevotella sp.]|nr:PfkB family carbohydrate kinase [Prevotella sp.]